MIFSRQALLVLCLVCSLFGGVCKAGSLRAGLTYSQLESIEKTFMYHVLLTGQIPQSQSEFDALFLQRPDIFRRGDSRDAWNRPLIYRRPSSHPARPHDFYSAGPDGRDDNGGGDDVVVWEDRGYYTGSHPTDGMALVIAVLLDGPLLLVVVVVMSVRHRKWRARAAASGA